MKLEIHFDKNQLSLTNSTTKCTKIGIWRIYLVKQLWECLNRNNKICYQNIFFIFHILNKMHNERMKWEIHKFEFIMYRAYLSKQLFLESKHVRICYRIKRPFNLWVHTTVYYNSINISCSSWKPGAQRSLSIVR